MNIGLDVVVSVHFSGVATYSYSLVKSLLRLDHANHYTLVVPKNSPASLRELVPHSLSSPPGVRVLYRGTSLEQFLDRSPTVLEAARAIVPDSLRAMWRSANTTLKLKKLGPGLAGVDVFHSSDMLCWNNRPGKNVITMHDITTVLFPEFHTKANIELHARKIAFASEYADKVIASSERTKQDLMKYCNVPEKRLKVIYLGCDQSRFRTYEENEVLQVLGRYGLTPGYILYVGVIEPRKNLARVVDAFELLQRMPVRPGMRLVIVGPRGWGGANLDGRIERSPVRDDILVLGSIGERDLPYIYNGAGVFVYPSLYEGFGLPVVEAMACGVPVIASNTSSLPEVVGDAGILVDPECSEALAAALYRVLSDEELAAAMGASAKKRARLFTWDKTAQDVLSVYEELVSR